MTRRRQRRSSLIVKLLQNELQLCQIIFRKQLANSDGLVPKLLENLKVCLLKP